MHVYNPNYVGVRRGCQSRGTPNFLMQSNNCAAKVDEQLVPLPEDAVQQFEELGGTITHFSPFGKDPIAHNHVLFNERDTLFQDRYPTFDNLFHRLVNGDDKPFCDAIYYYIHLTETLQQH